MNWLILTVKTEWRYHQQCHPLLCLFLDQKVVFCPLSKVQQDIYKTLLQTNDVQLVLKQGEPCDCRSELTRGKCCYTVRCIKVGQPCFQI